MILVLACLGVVAVEGADRPNILWITSEDNDYGWLGCYGNEQAVTPNLDKLAEGGVLFKHAYSNSPVCAVARSTILNGAYAVTQGTQHMRSRHKISEHYQPYVSYFRKAGYYCTNKTKTDYNFEGNDKALWDDGSNKAHYKNRPEGSPFFSVVNLTTSHESSLFESKIKSNRKKGVIPEETRVKVGDVELRPYLPDLLEIRNDVAIYHDVMTAMDKQVGELLSELEDAGLAEDTIVFYYGDHGGITPRGKRYLKDSGTHIPMLVHVPEKWKHLSPFKAGEKVDEMVAFVDLAPTVLSLVGMKKPAQMQGRAFLGEHRVEPGDDAVVFLYADRFDEIYGMRRGLVSDEGRWKYIRRFTPGSPAAPYSYYQFGQAGWVAWEKAWKAGKLADNEGKIWEPNQVVEELFDLRADPWEVKNLAGDAKYAERLKEMRERLKWKMVETGDSGVIPEGMFAELAPNGAISDYVVRRGDEFGVMVDVAFMAGEGDVGNVKRLGALLHIGSPVIRYWACQGLGLLGQQAAEYKGNLQIALADESAMVRVSAAQALYAMGESKVSADALLAELGKEGGQYVHLSVINVIKQCGLMDKISDEWVEEALKIKNDKSYVKRMAVQLKKARKEK